MECDFILGDLDLDIGEPCRIPGERVSGEEDLNRGDPGDVEYVEFGDKGE